MKIRPSIECWVIGVDEAAGTRGLLLRTPPNPANPSWPQFWQAITGGIEPGETAMAACYREVKEETGIELPPGSIQSANLELKFPVPELNWIIHKQVFWARTRVQPITLSAEHVDSRWVAFGEIEGMLHWDTSRQIYGEIRRLLGEGATM
jgi:dATP pyrophosphohydrolase